MASRHATVKVAVNFERLAEQLKKLSKSVQVGRINLEALAKALVLRAAVEHHGIASSDIRKVILRPGDYSQVQLYNWRKIDVTKIEP